MFFSSGSISLLTVLIAASDSVNADVPAPVRRRDLRDAPKRNAKKVAEGFGVYAEGPISNPSDLAPALARALKVVKSGNPALLDVVMQPR
jgi:thiamine pyrophosphate-dependent acetolactate synthase large subunit-like protein